MLDPLYEQQYIVVKIPKRFTAGDIILATAKAANISVYEPGERNDTHPPQNCIGAFIYNDNTFATGMFIASLMQSISKVFVLSDEPLPTANASFISCSPGYKRLEEKVREYLDEMRSSRLGAIIEPSKEGYAFRISGDIKVNPYKGLFVAIEKPDGAGGTTLQNNLAAHFAAADIPYILTEEPTNEAFGGLIRTALRGRLDMHLDSMQLLYTVDRIEHARFIYDALKQGKIVIESRYSLSTLMYAYNELPLGFLIAANSRVYWPDINLLISGIKPEVLISRITRRMEGREKFDHEDKLAMVTEGMQMLSKQFPSICYELDGMRDVDAITRQALRIIKTHPKFKALHS